MKLDIKLPMVYHTSLAEDDNFPHYIIASGEHHGIRFYICNINGMHPTAYLRIPKGKPLYGADCSYADEFIDVHCGFTYARGSLLGVENADDSWFLGWDYGHYGDFAGYYLRTPNDYLATHTHKWTTDKIIEECKKACDELANLWRIDNVIIKGAPTNERTESKAIHDVTKRQCYDRDEADKVSELMAENDRLKQEISDITDGFCDSTHMHIKELRHNKYKRCLAMAGLCYREYQTYCALIDRGEDYSENMDFYERWHKIWLTLAEQFKEAK